MKMITEDFRANLVELLAREGYGTKSALARFLNCSPAFVTQLANGDSEPTLRTVEQIAAFFNVSVMRLLRKTSKVA